MDRSAYRIELLEEYYQLSMQINQYLHDDEAKGTDWFIEMRERRDQVAILLSGDTMVLDATRHKH